MDKIKNKKVIDFFIIVSLFSFLFNKTCYLPDPLNKINSLISLGCVFFVFLYYIINFKPSKFSGFSIVFLLFFLLGTISCYMGDFSSIVTYFKVYYPILGMVLLLDILLSSERARFSILCLEKIFFIMILINFLTILLFPNGLFSDDLYSNNWFLLYDNLHIFIYIPGLIISEIASIFKKSKKLYYLMLIMVTYSVLFCLSATSIVGFFIYIVYIVLKKQICNFKFANSITYLIIYLCIFLFIVHFRFQEFFDVIIVDYLHRDLTFTGRTFLWDRIKLFIMEKPLLGYGIEGRSIFTLKMGGSLYTHAHNTIYDLLYKGGFIALGLFMTMVGLATKELYKLKKNVIANTISIGLFIMYTMMNFEAREDKIGLYIILILGVYVSNIIKSNEDNKKNISKVSEYE